MAYTRHGHHIARTPVELPFKGLRAKCGGVVTCQQCRNDAAMYHHPSNTKLRKKDV